MIDELLRFYANYPDILFDLKGIRRENLSAGLLEKLDFHGERQHEILSNAQAFTFDDAALDMLYGLCAGMKDDGLDEAFSTARLPFPAMLLTAPARDTSDTLFALITSGDGQIFTQIFRSNTHGFFPNMLVFCFDGAKATVVHTPTLSMSMETGVAVTEEDAVKSEQDLAMQFTAIAVGLAVLLEHKAMLEIDEVPLHSRPERRRAQKEGRNLSDIRVIKVRLGELGKRQRQAMKEDETESQGEKITRRAHWVQGHFMRNRAGGISWRNPHVRGAGPLVDQERKVEM